MKQALLVAALVLTALSAFADKIFLKDGRTFEGAIVEEKDDHVKIKTSKATLSFERDKIDRIEKGESPLQVRDKMLVALDPDQPQLYLELGKWLAGPGKDVSDPGMMKRICNIAAYLDKGQAGEAQATLGEYLLSKGQKEDATRAFARAISADPGNEVAKKNIGTLNDAVMEMNKAQLKELRAAIELAKDGKFRDAIPAIRKAKACYFADSCQKFMKMSILDLADNLQRRVPCETCKGAAKRKCTQCGGSGTVACTVCDGTGLKKNAKKTSFAEEVCGHCYHIGNLPCSTCEAERIYRVYTNVQVAGKNYSEVLLIGGRDRTIMRQEVDLGGWTRRTDKAKIVAIEADRPRTGGWIVCKDCRGIPYDPPVEAFDNWSALQYMDEMDLMLKGDKPIGGLAPEAIIFDPAIVEDQKFRWRGGAWQE